MQPKACNKIHQEQHNTREASSDFVVAKMLFPTSSLKLPCIWTVQSIPPPNQCLNKMGQNSGPTRSQQANEYWTLHNHANQTIKQSICSSTSPTAQQTNKHTHTHTLTQAGLCILSLHSLHQQNPPRVMFASQGKNCRCRRSNVSSFLDNNS